MNAAAWFYGQSFNGGTREQAWALPPRTYADLIGKAFAPGARGPLSFDCYGLVREVLMRNGIRVPDYPSSAERGHNAALILAALAQSETERDEKEGSAGWQETKVPEAGAVVLFRMEIRSGTHVGVMLDATRFIHVTEKTGVAIERVNSELWARRVMGYYRFTHHGDTEARR